MIQVLLFQVQKSLAIILYQMSEKKLYLQELVMLELCGLLRFRSRLLIQVSQEDSGLLGKHKRN